MELQYGAYVNIVTLVIYFTYLCLAIYLSIRQGLGHNFPWICIAILSLCRLTQVYILAPDHINEPADMCRWPSI
jgi:hypothetical protein